MLNSRLLELGRKAAALSTGNFTRAQVDGQEWRPSHPPSTAGGAGADAVATSPAVGWADAHGGDAPATSPAAAAAAAAAHAPVAALSPHTAFAPMLPFAAAAAPAPPPPQPTALLGAGGWARPPSGLAGGGATGHAASAGAPTLPTLGSLKAYLAGPAAPPPAPSSSGAASSPSASSATPARPPPSASPPSRTAHTGAARKARAVAHTAALAAATHAPMPAKPPRGNKRKGGARRGGELGAEPSRQKRARAPADADAAGAADGGDEGRRYNTRKRPKPNYSLAVMDKAVQKDIKDSEAAGDAMMSKGLRTPAARKDTTRPRGIFRLTSCLRALIKEVNEEWRGVRLDTQTALVMATTMLRPLWDGESPIIPKPHEDMTDDDAHDTLAALLNTNKARVAITRDTAAALVKPKNPEKPSSNYIPNYDLLIAQRRNPSAYKLVKGELTRESIAKGDAEPLHKPGRVVSGSNDRVPRVFKNMLRAFALPNPDAFFILEHDCPGNESTVGRLTLRLDALDAVGARYPPKELWPADAELTAEAPAKTHALKWVALLLEDARLFDGKRLIDGKKIEADDVEMVIEFKNGGGYEGARWCLKDEAEQVLTALDVDLANVQKMLVAANEEAVKTK